MSSTSTTKLQKRSLMIFDGSMSKLRDTIRNINQNWHRKSSKVFLGNHRFVPIILISAMQKPICQQQSVFFPNFISGGRIYPIYRFLSLQYVQGDEKRLHSYLLGIHVCFRGCSVFERSSLWQSPHGSFVDRGTRGTRGTRDTRHTRAGRHGIAKTTSTTRIFAEDEVFVKWLWWLCLKQWGS